LEADLLPYIEVLGVKIALYGTLIVIGTAAGMAVAVSRSAINAQKKEDIIYAFFFAIIGVIVGAKLLYIVTVLPDLIEKFDMLIHNRGAILSLLTGGFVFYGGLIGGVIGVMLYCRQFKVVFWPLVDTLIPSVPLIHAFGRLGCFCAGCCYGREFPPPFGVYFNSSPFAPHDVTLFPVQLLEAFLCLCIFSGLVIFARKRKGNGIVLGFYLLFYTVVRFVLEFFRMDEIRGILLGLSTSQWISVFLLGVSIILLLRPLLRVKEKRT
jgi:phosphatidylglycerol:prolipoprotein diacylglycerol transferase